MPVWHKVRVGMLKATAGRGFGDAPVSGFDRLAAARSDMLALLLGSFAFLVAFILWFDNTQTVTSNGVFKALTVRTWMADPANARLDPSNYLYYPLMAVLCRLLDIVGVMPGDPRHQLSIINAFFAAISLCIIYRLVLHLTGQRLIAWAAAAFHLAGGFFFNLAVSNEDILPSYAALLGAMALAVVWLPEANWKRIAGLSTLFTLAWLLEWRLMFPTLPGLLLAIAMAPGTVWQRIGRLSLFLALMVGLAKVAILLWGPHQGNVGPVEELLWTGKGVYTGWAGFAESKLVFLWVGVTEYLVGGSNLGNLNFLSPLLPEMYVSTAIIGLIGVISLIIILRHWTSPGIRFAAVIFGTTFVAGEVMNLYSQPQDPQMQLNVMPWLTIGCALAVASVGQWRPAVAATAVVALAAALLSYNIHRIMPLRGGENVWRQVLQRFEVTTDPARTVFLFHGFDQIVSEMFYEWNGDWTYFARLGPAPNETPKAKLLVLVNGFIHHPSDTAEQSAQRIESQISRAIDLGYKIVTNNVWERSEADFVSSMSTVADQAKASALYRMLHGSFAGTLLFDDPQSGRYFVLEKRPQPAVR